MSRGANQSGNLLFGARKPRDSKAASFITDNEFTESAKVRKFIKLVAGKRHHHNNDDYLTENALKQSQIIFHADLVKVLNHDYEAWFKGDKFHRVDGPALIQPGSTHWMIDDVHHRDSREGPAMICGFGSYWLENGKAYREDGPVVEGKQGQFMWQKNGKIHKDDGPAMFWDGEYQWYLYGKKMSETDFLVATRPASLNQYKKLLGARRQKGLL